MEGLILTLFFIGLTLFIYFKIPKNSVFKFPLILILFIFSIIISISLMSNYEIIGSPFLQIFLILFQTIIFLITSLEYFYVKKEKENE